MDVTILAEQINKAAPAYRVGALQQHRAGVAKLQGKPGPRTKSIFHKGTIFLRAEGGYAFHDGGRTELQFNIGVEMRGTQRCWRHGVAFSFEKGRNLPDPNRLRPKVRRFNEWVQANAGLLRGFRMWHWNEMTRSPDRSPGEILQDSIDAEAFVFLGTMVPEAKVDVHQILRDFDRLYDLYEYVESEPKAAGKALSGGLPHRQVSKATRTIMSRLAGEIEVDLRHNLLQQLLVTILKREFPGCPVEPERKVAGGGRVDMAVETHDGVLFCEIKVAPHVRAALREAVGQLLEYSHWPTDCRAKKWWVLSEGLPSAEEVAYLQVVRGRYGLPIFYRRIDTEMATLGLET
ncbi:MAG: hypothetical protein ABR915_08770 [Thermoguttaceae bacterium]|jgi:hypothetical protein